MAGLVSRWICHLVTPTRNSEEPKISNPRFFREEEKELARVQRKLSKTPKGTPERKKALKVVELVHERIADRRNDFANKVSRQLVDRYGVIIFEDLDIKNMLKNHSLAKSISDVAWNMLVKATESKAAYAGSKVVLVDPRQTSQMCSRCGLIVNTGGYEALKVQETRTGRPPWLNKSNLVELHEILNNEDRHVNQGFFDLIDY